MTQEREESYFVAHLPCPECGSRDANSQYSDGHTHCYSCGHHTNGDGTKAAPGSRPRKEGLITGEARGLVSRKITEQTCKHFGYQVGELRGKQVQIAPYFDADGNLVAQHLRTAKKDFPWLGDPKEALPFGAHCWPKTGKMIVVTEGEIDALSMSQVQGNKWPVVSIGCGAGPQIRKYFAKHREYFCGFDKVVLMFDMDDAGRQAAKDAAAVLGARAHIADLPLKDPSEMLVAGRAEELNNAMWRAKQYRPEGVVDLADLKSEVMKRPEWGLSWPFETLTKMTYGIRRGEIYALGAGTGIGKTDFYTQVMKHMVLEHKVPIGVFALEQMVAETATRLAGKAVGKVFHVPDAGWTDADKEAAWEKLQEGGKVYLYDSFGQNDWAIIQEKIEYLHHAHGVNHFFLDHLTALAAWKDDERKELEVIMSEIGSLVKRLNITLLFVSHLATPEGKPHEEGGRVAIRHFKGSRAIGFWSVFMFGMERDQQADSPNVRKTTTFRILKDRYTGRSTGAVFYLGYNEETGMLYETDEPDAGKAHGFDDEQSEGDNF
jgi:twinkle protein